jgi:hypothetical protein
MRLVADGKMDRTCTSHKAMMHILEHDKVGLTFAKGIPEIQWEAFLERVAS